MPPRRNSRHLFTTAQKRDNANALFLSDRVPFRYVDLTDNSVHTVRAGDTLQGLASRHFAPLGRLPFISAATLWWVIADFQPLPIHDPTIQLVDGEKLVIPSIRTVLERIIQPPRNV